jgi:hypothetical protein
MKNLVIKIITILYLATFTFFFTISQSNAQSVSYTIINKGSKPIKSSEKDENVTISGASKTIQAGKSETVKGSKIGRIVIVECNDKKQIFTVKSKKNEFVVNCN